MTPNNLRSVSGVLAPRIPGVPVMVYHGLSESPEQLSPAEWKYWLRPTEFKRHLEQIRIRGDRVMPMRHLSDVRYNRGAAIVITFDDGRFSDYECAFPMLSDANVSADFFVNTALIGKPGYLSWEQLAEMQRGGMSIESHGHEHLDLAVLPRKQLERQLSVSKSILEDRLGSAVVLIAAPYGRLNHTVIEVALQVGYLGVCSARGLPARYGAAKLNRVVLYRDTPLTEFNEYLDRNPVRYLKRMARPLYSWPLRMLLRND